MRTQLSVPPRPALRSRRRRLVLYLSDAHPVPPFGHRDCRAARISYKVSFAPEPYLLRWGGLARQTMALDRPRRR